MPFFLPALLWGAAQGGKTGLQNKEKGKKREAKQGSLDKLSKLLLAGQGGPADPGFGQSAAGAPTAANPGGAQAASADPEMQRWIQGLMAVAGSGAEGQDTAIAQMLKTLMPDAGSDIRGPFEKCTNP